MRPTDSLSAGVAIGPIRSTQGSCAISGNTITCDLGALLPGDSATMSVTMTATAAGTITDAAQVKSRESDPDLGNNTAGLETPVYPVTVCAADITDQVAVALTATSVDVSTNHVRATLQLRNKSGLPIAGPIFLMVTGLMAGVEVVNPAGTPHCVEPLATPCVSVDVGPENVLSPGESGTATIEFALPTSETVSFHPRVLAGSNPP